MCTFLRNSFVLYLTKCLEGFFLLFFNDTEIKLCTFYQFIMHTPCCILWKKHHSRWHGIKTLSLPCLIIDALLFYSISSLNERPLLTDIVVVDDFSALWSLRVSGPLLIFSLICINIVYWIYTHRPVTAASNDGQVWDGSQQ